MGNAKKWAWLGNYAVSKLLLTSYNYELELIIIPLKSYYQLGTGAGVCYRLSWYCIQFKYGTHGLAHFVYNISLMHIKFHII